MRSFRLNRRALLRGAGGVAVVLPLLEAMTGRHAGAAATPGTKRFVLFYTPNATNNPAEFVPTQTGPAFVLGKETAPLDPLRKKLLILSGINMESAKKDDGDLHSVGMSHMLTATRWVPAMGYEKPGGAQFTVGFAGGISVDQYIAKKIGAATRFPSLEFGVISITDYGVHPFGRMIYTGSNQPVPAQDDPAVMFKRVFGDGTPAAGNIDQVLAQRKSVLDYVTDDFTRLQPKLGATDQKKIDAHLTAVRNLEVRLSKGGPTTTCGTSKPFANMGDPMDKANIPNTGKAQMDLLILALQCDSTRVASLQWSWARSQLSHPWAGVNESHHTLSHGGATDPLSAINTWYTKQLVYLATQMDAIDEGGKSLLDNTLIYWCGECARGYDHDFNNIRAFILGTAGGAIKTGQHLHCTNEPHNKLLVTLMNAMGVADNQFGDPTYATGPLAGVSAV